MVDGRRLMAVIIGMAIRLTMTTGAMMTLALMMMIRRSVTVSEWPTW
jgi:hypothetical protein